MAKFLYWKAKVVHNLAGSVIFLFSYQGAISQSSEPESGSPKITIKSEAPFIDILNELEARTGLHFVYSTNIIQVDKMVSINVAEKPMDYVLDLLGQQMKLAFKRNGQHVVIKRADQLLPVAYKSHRSGKAPSANAAGNPEKALSGAAENIQYADSDNAKLQQAPGSDGPFLGNNYFKKPQVNFNTYFGAAKLPDLPEKYLNSVSLNNSHPGWFVSAAFVLNDYSAGAELQGGLRSIYLVFSPTWLKDGRYHGAYGVGTSFLMKHNVSLNTVYTYAVLKDEQSNSAVEVDGFSKDDLASSSKHHQVRFMIQYSITRNISLRGGLAINHMTTTHQFPTGDFVAYKRSVFSSISVGGGYSSYPYRQASIAGNPEPPPGFQTINMWMGWETSVSYKINFFQR